MSIYKKNNEKTFDNFKKIVLDDSLFMMLCQLQVYSKMNLLYIYLCFLDSSLCPPPFVLFSCGLTAVFNVFGLLFLFHVYIYMEKNGNQ